MGWERHDSHLPKLSLNAAKLNFVRVRPCTYIFINVDASSQIKQVASNLAPKFKECLRLCRSQSTRYSACVQVEGASCFSLTVLPRKAQYSNDKPSSLPFSACCRCAQFRRELLAKCKYDMADCDLARTCAVTHVQADYRGK